MMDIEKSKKIDNSVSLTKPIRAHDETVTKLTFREPTGADIARCGFPYKMEENSLGRTVKTVDTEAMGAYISSLAGIPSSSVAQLSFVDFARCMGAVMVFFADGETQEKPSTAIST